MSDHKTPQGKPAGHELPVSSGYGTQGTRVGEMTVSVYCGRCKASCPATRSWAVRYFAAQKKEVERQISKGYATRGALVDLDDDNARVLTAIAAMRTGQASHA
jgi:hypothetical protein